MNATVTKVFRFEAAHHLPNHDGKCRYPHGHSYRVAVRCEGPINDRRLEAKYGMVIDFADLKTIWKEDLEPLLDHRDLNESLSKGVEVTTAECLAAYICKVFAKRHIGVKEVEVWETETSGATVTASEVWANGG